MGGKVPEAYYHREKFNKLDATGLAEPLAKVMSERLKNKKLPQKTDSESSSLSQQDELDAVALPFTFSSSNFPSFAEEFPFESNKLFNFDKKPYARDPAPVENYNTYSDDLDFNQIPKQTPVFNDIEQGVDGGGGYGDIPKKKPHLFTQDPYVSGIANDHENEPKFKPPPNGYLPPVGPYNTEFDGYGNDVGLDEGYHTGEDEFGYFPDEDVYHDPEFGPEYSPPPPHVEYAPIPPHDDYGAIHEDYGPIPHHDDYGPPPSDGYGPPSADYGAPSADYGPPKLVGPVLLDKRPYEVKEIKAVPIVTHETYTKFDCRNVPYPDRHYADPEAGCAVRLHFLARRPNIT